MDEGVVDDGVEDLNDTAAVDTITEAKSWKGAIVVKLHNPQFRQGLGRPTIRLQSAVAKIK